MHVSKQEGVQEQFRRKMYQDVNGNRKLFWKKVKEYLRKRGLDVRQARRMGQNRSEWWGFVRGNAWGIAQVMNP